MIIGKGPIAMQFLKPAKQPLDIVQCVGSQRMAGDLGNLPRRQTGEDRVGQRLALGFQPGDLIADVQVLFSAEMPQFLKHRFQLGNRLFKIQTVIRVHGGLTAHSFSGRRIARYSDSFSRRTNRGIALPLGKSLAISTK